MAMKLYRIVTGREDDRFILELYVEHPEDGPPGTPGRGPYCVSWSNLTRSQVPEVRAAAKAQGIHEMPDHA